MIFVKGIGFLFCSWICSNLWGLDSNFPQMLGDGEREDLLESRPPMVACEINWWIVGLGLDCLDDSNICISVGDLDLRCFVTSNDKCATSPYMPISFTNITSWIHDNYIKNLLELVLYNFHVGNYLCFKFHIQKRTNHLLQENWQQKIQVNRKLMKI